MSETTSRQNQRSWAKRNPLKKLEYHLRSYGLTIGDYWRAYSSQDYSCAICRTGIEPTKVGQGRGRGRNTAAIDHHHGTKIFRGLLCIKCNSGLGMFNESPHALREAALYIERHHV